MPCGSGMISPTTVARAPCGCVCIAATAASASSGRYDRDELALVGDVQRIDAEHVAGAEHLWLYG